jgi:hypothetical protein
MPNTTPKHALPYPLPTEPVNQGAANFQALATKLDSEYLIPPGGAAGAYLAKSSAADFAAGWVPLGGGWVPAGGTPGQVLSKTTGADFDTQWVTPAGGGGGPTTIRGVVSAAGAVSQGTGFTVVKGSTGIYTLNFTVAFAAAPVVVLTVLDATGGSQWTANLTSVSASSAVLFIRKNTTGNGSAIDAIFHFVAMAP